MRFLLNNLIAWLLISKTGSKCVFCGSLRRLFTMAFSLNKLKNLLNTSKDGQLAGSGSLEPEIGFKLALHPINKTLYVTVIGARHLPSLFGLSRAHGYLVKVTFNIIVCINIPSSQFQECVFSLVTRYFRYLY